MMYWSNLRAVHWSRATCGQVAHTRNLHGRSFGFCIKFACISLHYVEPYLGIEPCSLRPEPSDLPRPAFHPAGLRPGIFA